VRASSPPEACAVAGARLAEVFAAAERVGSGSARAHRVQDERFRDGNSAVPQAGGHCAPVAQRGESSRDEMAAAHCLVDLADSLAARLADDSSPAGYSELANSAALTADGSCPSDCSAATVRADSAALTADDSVVED